MLAERFKLRTHLEMRLTPIFALTIERRRRARALAAARRDRLRKSRSAPAQHAVVLLSVTEGLLLGRGVTLDQIAGELDAGRIIVNRSDLAGRYNVELRWNTGLPRPRLTLPMHPQGLRRLSENSLACASSPTALRSSTW